MLVVYQRTSKKGKIYGGKKSLLHTKTIQAVEDTILFQTIRNFLFWIRISLAKKVLLET